jgi:hypothetical protein
MALTADTYRPKPKDAGAPFAEPSKEDKEGARQALIAADRFVKQLDFVRARSEIERALTLDPTNPYLGAFIERIAYFEQQASKYKESQSAPAPKVVPTQVAPPVPSFTPPPAAASVALPAPHVAPPASVHAAPHVPQFTPPPVPTPPVVEMPSKILEMNPRGPAPVPQVPHAEPRPVAPPPPPKPVEDVGKKEIASALEQMQKQIEQLTHALEQERVAREDSRKKQAEAAVGQLRVELEKAWQNGTPREEERQRLHQMAVSLLLTEDVESSLVKDIKIEMYGRAVKQMIAKRKMLRSSSSALEWLRKVYNISVQEYIENESKFLLDLVADQFKGTILYVAGGKAASSDVVTRLKGSGYTVMMAATPEVALERLDKIRPNIIVSEQQFPESVLNGETLLKLVHTNPRYDFIPFVLLSGEETWPQVEALDLKQNEGRMKKPVDYDQLTILLNEKLAQLREYLSSLS